MKSFTALLLFVILEKDERAEAAISWLEIETGRQTQKSRNHGRCRGSKSSPRLRVGMSSPAV